jgi:endonuclease YncB( thermonuclease family)
MRFSIKVVKMLLLALVCAGVLAACEIEYTPVDSGGSSDIDGMIDADEHGRVVDVIDGDTIDVEIDGQVYRVRYIGVNTPERDEPCYREARDANAAWVDGRMVTLERDQSETDRFDRLLRYVYVGDVFVNAALVQDGYAEAVLYPPDDREWDFLVSLEQNAAAVGAGCHPSGIFADGTYER